nr:MAG TPA: hypothetical protein [Caudoviricetes sp.]
MRQNKKRRAVACFATALLSSWHLCLLPACVCAGAVSQPEPVYNGIRSA